MRIFDRPTLEASIAVLEAAQAVYITGGGDPMDIGIYTEAAEQVRYVQSFVITADVSGVCEGRFYLIDGIPRVKPVRFGAPQPQAEDQ